MVVSSCTAGHMWGRCHSEPYGPLALEPAATVLNYGQGVFEGIKAYRTSRGRIVLFRPQKNALRMAEGARRLMMPPVPTQLFMEACSMAVKENAAWVPPCGRGALYLRPLLFGSGADLGVKPSSRYSLVVFASPVGSYFGGAGARMRICLEHPRAALGGQGHVKAVGNYAQCFAAQRDAKADGFSDVIYLDAGGDFIDEAAASNFFCVDADGVIHTPQLGTILPGVTRDSIIQLVRRRFGGELHLKVGKVSTETALSASEAFLTGTGAGVIPVAHIASEERGLDLPCPGPVTRGLRDALLDLQLERADDPFGWLYDPFVEPAFGRDSFMEPTF